MIFERVARDLCSSKLFTSSTVLAQSRGEIDLGVRPKSGFSGSTARFPEVLEAGREGDTTQGKNGVSTAN